MKSPDTRPSMKLPSFPFYVNDWLSSSRVRLMTPAERGAYIDLLAYDWADDGIPNDDDKLASLSGLGDTWFNGSAQVLKACFVNHPAKVGFLTNVRLQQVRLEYLEWRETKSQVGKYAAQKRWGKEPPVKEWFPDSSETEPRSPDATPIDLAMPKKCPPIDLAMPKNALSPSLSPSSTKEQHRANEVVVPSLNEVLEWGRLDGFPEETCRAFWEHHEGLGWMCGGTPIRNPRVWLRGFVEKRKRVRPVNKVRGESAGSVVFQKKTRMEALEKLLQDHPAHPGAAYADPPTPEQRKEYRGMMDEVQRLRHELARGVGAEVQSPKSPESKV